MKALAEVTAPPPWYLRANGALAEADLIAVANHDFSRLAPPILVGCQDLEQFEEFIFREGLMCSEVKRLRGSSAELALYPDSKILVLLPGWDDHAKTHELVCEWVNVLDRYTVELRSPRSLARKRRAWGWIFLLSALGWGAFVAWLLTRR